MARRVLMAEVSGGRVRGRPRLGWMDGVNKKINAKKGLYEGVIIVPTALYGAEAWGMRSAESRTVNVLEMKCLRSLVGVLRMDRVGNEEVRRGARIERGLASRADVRVL